MNTEGAIRFDCPVDVTTPKMVDKAHDMVTDDPKLKVCEIAESWDGMYMLNILHECCHMRKLCERWVHKTTKNHFLAKFGVFQQQLQCFASTCHHASKRRKMQYSTDKFIAIVFLDPHSTRHNLCGLPTKRSNQKTIEIAVGWVCWKIK